MSINNHKWSDEEWTLNTVNPKKGDEISLYQWLEDDPVEVYINKSDAEALAKHFELDQKVVAVAEFDAVNLEPVQELIKVLGKYRAELPEDLVKELCEMGGNKVLT